MTGTDENGVSRELVPLDARAVGMVDTLGIRFTDPQEFSWLIAERLAAATSLDELLDGAGTVGWRDRPNEPFVIRGVRWVRSSFHGGPGFFAIVDAVDSNGEPCVLTSGAVSVIIQLARGMQQGWWDDVPVKLLRSDTPTADGYFPLRLAKA
jgi:hypothetical protein